MPPGGLQGAGRRAVLGLGVVVRWDALLPQQRPAHSAAVPLRGACGLPLPVAEKGRPQAAQRSSECKRP